jgi:hypothetical protein
MGESANFLAMTYQFYISERFLNALWMGQQNYAKYCTNQVKDSGLGILVRLSVSLK